MIELARLEIIFLTLPVEANTAPPATPRFALAASPGSAGGRACRSVAGVAHCYYYKVR